MIWSRGLYTSVFDIYSLNLQEDLVMGKGNSNTHHRHRFHGTHYVVSEDIDILVERWCRNNGLKPPAKRFYGALRARMLDFLHEIFARVTIINSERIRAGLSKLAAKHKKNGLTVVSLERVYLEETEIHGRIELTRTVNGFGDEIIVHGTRYGTPEKSIQFRKFRGKKLALIDDVLFSGKTLIETIQELLHNNANVHAVVTAIGVKNGVDRLKGTNFGVIGMPAHMTVHCLEEFDEVSDQVCERDFYPGVPYSGRQYIGGNAAFPYIRPFGKLDKWASIPEKELARFSKLCLDNTIALFEEIGRVNNTVITCSMVPRPVYGFPVDKTPFVSALKETRLRVTN